MEQGQDLGGATADVLVRLGGRLFARLPGYAGMRHGLERPRLVLAPDRQPKLGAERVGSLDQPLFTIVSGSTRVTVPCLRRRMTTPVWHQARLFCQRSPSGVLRKAPDGRPQVSTYTIWRTLHAAGLSWQKSRTWCQTGVVMRRRKQGTVTRVDPDTMVKRG